MHPPAHEPCPLCGGTTTAAFTTRDRNREITLEDFRYRRCRNCEVIYLQDVPDDLVRFYPSEEYFGLPAIDALRAQATGERYRMEIVARHVSGGRMIEIGPGDGLLAVQALDMGFDVAAIEADPAAAANLRNTLGIEVVESASPEEVLPSLGPADAVVGWHVIEHVPRPWALLEQAAAVLRPGGAVVLATPNPRAFGLRVLGSRWPHIDAPRHLFLLPHAAVVERGRALGLEPVQLTATDPGGLFWNAFAWRYALRRPGARWARERAAHLAGDAIATVLAPIERRGLRGAAYTLVLRKS